MQKFFFTYGCEGQPYVGGWTDVYAENEDQAIAAFEAFHPRKDGFINCSSIYSEQDFLRTKMADVGNMGARCHEKILLQRELIDREEAE